ncbi:MAG: hypothetical protein ACPGVH_03140 [Chitinophagales bacterium]
MSKKNIKSIGTVIPLGDGATGKSLITKLLIDNVTDQELANKLAQDIKKSLNIELEYCNELLEFEDKTVSTTLQYHVFPGQRQKISNAAPTFSEIVEIFNFLPSLKEVKVLLMVYDVTRIESLKSLESWLAVAMQRQWISNETKIILVSNKIDLVSPNQQFIENIQNGIHQMLTSEGISINKNQICSKEVSALSLKGINDLRKEIFDWVAHNGKQREVSN